MADLVEEPPIEEPHVEEPPAPSKKKHSKKKKTVVTEEQPDNEHDNEEEETIEGEGQEAKKKRKKKKKKAKAPAEAPAEEAAGSADPSTTKTLPPPITKQFPSGNYPLGEPMEYGVKRETTEEMRFRERLMAEDIAAYRRAAEAHRQTRQYAQSLIRPGMVLEDFCTSLEDRARHLIEGDGLDAGLAFPTGVSLNHVAAHYTPNTGDRTTFSAGDVMKVDFGIHVGGLLIDCAWTHAPDPKFKGLLDAVKDATDTGLKTAGIDVRLSTMGEAIQEAMESHEIELDGKIYQVKCVRNLNGHLVGRHTIHAGKSVPLIKGPTQGRMEEGEVYAIETFGTTGRGHVSEDMECSHYMMSQDAHMMPAPRNPKSKALLGWINRNHGTLAFCRRWLDRGQQTRHLMALKHLVDNRIVQAYPPLCDVKGSYVAQFEHTIYLKPSGKEVLSRGFDF